MKMFVLALLSLAAVGAGATDTQVYLRDASGGKEALNVDLNGSVFKVKQQMEDNGHDRAQYLYLIHQGEPMDNNRTLESYKVVENSIIDWFSWEGLAEQNDGPTDGFGERVWSRLAASKQVPLMEDPKHYFVNFYLLSLRNGKYDHAHFNKTQPVSDVANFLGQVHHLEPKCIYMAFQHRLLHNNETVGHYYIRKHSTVAWIDLKQDCAK